MRDVLRLIFLLVTTVFCSVQVYACTCEVESLSKRFRRAEAVFIGQLVGFQTETRTDIQNFKDGLPVLEVKQSWKGIEKKFVAVSFDFRTAGANCPFFSEFAMNRDYLVFAYGRELRVYSGCPDTKPVGVGYTEKEAKRLSNFWFRTRARVWPF